MVERLLFVYNPNAGRGEIREYLSEIVEMFAEHNCEVTIFPTRKQGDAARIVRERAAGFDRVVCCGGDGTLNEVTDGLMELENKIPCGYIPAGTVNDFAHSFNLPSDMIEAAQIAVTGDEFLYDIGDLNGDYFDYIAAFGAFTEVSYETSQISKNILGKLAYFFEGVKKLPSLRKYKVKIQIGDELLEEEVIYGMISNSFSVAGFLSLFDDDVALDDGKLEAFFIKAPKNILEFQAIINGLLMKDMNCKHFMYYHVDEIKIKSRKLISWTVDGEYGGSYKEVCIKNHSRAIPFVRRVL